MYLDEEHKIECDNCSKEHDEREWTILFTLEKTRMFLDVDGIDEMEIMDESPESLFQFCTFRCFMEWLKKTLPTHTERIRKELEDSVMRGRD